MANRAEFMVIMELLRAAYPNWHISQDRWQLILRTWHERLGGTSPSALRKAVDRAIKECDDMPGLGAMQVYCDLAVKSEANKALLDSQQRLDRAALPETCDGGMSDQETLAAFESMDRLAGTSLAKKWRARECPGTRDD